LTDPAYFPNIFKKLKGRDIFNFRLIKKYLLGGVSVFVTVSLLYYVFSQNRLTDWERILLHLNPWRILLYLGLYGLGLLFRTFRYHLLLKSSLTPLLPSFWNLTLVTSVRNMLVDFLPARAGSLSYIILLNRAFKVDISPCLFSFTYAFLFDLLAMAPLLAFAILVESLTSHKTYPWLWAVALLILVMALVLILSLGPLIKHFSKWSNLTSQRWEKYPRIGKIDQHLQTISQSFLTIKEQGIFWPTLVLSILIRTVKYLGLYILLTAVLQAFSGQGTQLPFWVVLLGLVGSEAAAGLPIGGLAGFGFYEGVLGGLLSSQGIPPSQAMLVSFAMHFLTQVVDYSLGGGALLYILIGVMRKKPKRDYNKR
jgi:uncharacterized membrane protein YbhN (UPF0104 family)